MTEIDTEDKELVVPESEAVSTESPERNGTYSTGRMYNDTPLPFQIVVKWDNRHRNLWVLTPGHRGDVPAGYDLYMKSISGYEMLVEFGSANPQTFWYRFIAKVSAGQTVNISSLLGRSGSSATGEDGAEQTSDTAQDHQ